MQNVIACIDGSASTLSVCDYAAWASTRYGLPLTLLHVLDRAQYPIPGDLSGCVGLGSREHLLDELTRLDEQRARLAREQGEHMLAAAQQRAAEAASVQASVLQRHGNLVDTLRDLETDMRLLVIGKQGEHTSSTGVGSQVESVARTLHRPMLIATGAYKEPKRAVIAFDGSETARKAVQMIGNSALFQGLDCHVLFTGQASAANSEQLEWARQTLAAAGIQTQQVVREGEVADVIPQYIAEHAMDMLVMGAYGHSAIRRFLVGSTTTRMIQQTSVPLLLLR
ncbi:putative UspA universal stress protein [Pseudomonas luteola]|uniref:Putative UspA universal stress protein n=1 Tax=Pseudomonas luteola TaxID=47886 RepID=A0A2X2E6N6_PSELU|nr:MULTISPECIES: universal stress protein [Pseudomonas]SPZ02480.1 putative UspA universal stress protein [Pseudomonas luteola]